MSDPGPNSAQIAHNSSAKRKVITAVYKQMIQFLYSFFWQTFQHIYCNPPLDHQGMNWGIFWNADHIWGAASYLACVFSSSAKKAISLRKDQPSAFKGTGVCSKFVRANPADVAACLSVHSPGAFTSDEISLSVYIEHQNLSCVMWGSVDVKCFTVLWWEEWQTKLLCRTMLGSQRQICAWKAQVENQLLFTCNHSITTRGK